MTENANVSATVFVQDNASIADERSDGSLQRVVDAATTTVRRYDTDGKVPQMSFDTLENGTRHGLSVANDTDGPDILVYVTDGNTQDVNKAAVESALEKLDDETMVVFVVTSNQADEVDTTWFDHLDNTHAKAAQIDVIYADREDVTQVFGREVDEFMRNRGVNANV